MLLCIIILFSTQAQAVRITDVDVKTEPVDYYEEFTVVAKLSGDTGNYEALFYIDDFVFSRKNVPPDAKEISAKFALDAAQWDLHKIGCGLRNARVELYTSITKSLHANETYEFEIGHVPEMIFNPPQPTPGKSVQVKLVDANKGTALNGVDVQIKDIYGGAGINKKTGGDGTFVFTPDIPGEYRITFKQRDVCGEKVFYIKRPLIVDGPHPTNPVVNEMINVAVPAGSSVGVKVFDMDGNLYRTVRSSYNGGANFTIADAGEYIITFGDLSTRYWSLNKTLEVSDRMKPELVIAPNQPVVGKPVTVTVTSREQPLDYAKVIVVKPDGVEREFTASNFGTFTYDAVTSTGIYEVLVTKDRYAPHKANFQAQNAFIVKVTPERPTVKESISIFVTDQDNKPISDVLVEVAEMNIRKVTDMGGKLTLDLQEPKTYTFKLSKDTFWDYSFEVVPYGMLSLGECVTDLGLGENITFNVFNSFGELTDAEILVRQPNGIVQQFVGTTKTYQPDLPGKYEVSIKKTNYASDNITFIVKPYPLEIVGGMGQGILTINVTHLGKPVPQLGVMADIFGTTKTATTNVAGQASFEVTSEGNLTVTVNKDKANIIYEERTANFGIIRSYQLIYLATPLIIIFIIAVFTVISIQLGRRYLGDGFDFGISTKSGDSPKKTMRESQLGGSGKTRLSKL